MMTCRGLVELTKTPRREARRASDRCRIRCSRSASACQALCKPLDPKSPLPNHDCVRTNSVLWPWTIICSLPPSFKSAVTSHVIRLPEIEVSGDRC